MPPVLFQTRINGGSKGLILDGLPVGAGRDAHQEWRQLTLRWPHHGQEHS
ncbi:MAG: hypothetical protein U0792_17930 [Gemmataceae bacterium]